jgi:hypothetical protein
MSRKSSQNFNEGDLVILRVTNKNITEDGLMTVSNCGSCDMGLVYERINVASYPSSNDFFGKTVVLEDGLQGIITKKVGRPFKILEADAWKKYDIYEVLFKGYTCQVFDYNLERLNEEYIRLVYKS